VPASPPRPSGTEADKPPWRIGDSIPDPDRYMGAERVVADALAVLGPFKEYDPRWALPFARAALDAYDDWGPDYQSLAEIERLRGEVERLLRRHADESV
jgi:hypothetical protein